MKKFILFFFLLCLTLSSFSQERQFTLRDLKLPDSFNDRVISLVEQDNAGLLWLVANGGLYRYDGNEIIQFNRESDPAIPHSSITAIFADVRNNLWIGAQDGLTRFDLHDWTTTRIKTENASRSENHRLRVSTIGQGKDGSIYAGTIDGKLFHVARDTLVKLLDIHEDYPGKYKSPTILTVEEPYPGEIWLSTSFDKLIRIKINKRIFAPAEYIGLERFNQAPIDDIRFHPSGKCLIVVSQHGLYLLDTRTGAFKEVKKPHESNLGKDRILYMESLNTDEAVLLSNHPALGKDKLLIYNFLADTVTEKTLLYPDHLTDNRIKWLRNTGNSLLISLDSHIMEIAPSTGVFKNFLVEANALNSIRSIYKDPGGTLFAGSYKDGFIRVDETTGKREILSPEFVYSILPWNADTLLLGTEGGGLFWYEPGKNKFSPLHIRSAREGERPLGHFLTVLERENTHLILAGAYEGLFLVDPYAETSRMIREDELGQTKILSIAKLAEKRIIGTSRGIFEWDSRTDSLSAFLRNQEPAEPNPVYCTARLNKQVWIGTHGYGIFIADEQGQVIDTIDNSRGLANNIVYSLLARGAYVIAGTNTGLSIINSKTGEVRNYFRKDQLSADEFNGAANFSTGSTVYLGTINGIARFNIDSLNTAEKPESNIPIRVTNLTTEHVRSGIWHNYSLPYTGDSALVIGSNVRYFSIAFGGPDKSPGRLAYYYRLDDRNEWHAIGKQQEITFVQMPPGNYDLQLAARLPDGQWTNSLLRVPLIVKPAFRQTIWFKVLVVLAIGLIIWGIFKYRENTLLKEKKLRIKIAGDLHDEVGSSLTRIYYQADTLSANPHPRPDNRKQLQKIAANSQDALLTMGDLVWSIDSRFDTMKDLVIRMKDYLYKLRKELSMDFRFNMHGEYEATPLSQMVRQNLFLIFKEAITNAIKHGDGSEIIINLDLKHSIHLEIKNGYSGGNSRTEHGKSRTANRKSRIENGNSSREGSGRNNSSSRMENYQGGRGLESMQRRAANMKGELSISGENGIFLLKLAYSENNSFKHTPLPKRGV